jgi:hypothetical protein
MERFLSVPAFVRFRGLTERAALSLRATLGFCAEAPLLEPPHAQETPDKVPAVRKRKRRGVRSATGRGS